MGFNKMIINFNGINIDMDGVVAYTVTPVGVDGSLYKIRLKMKTRAGISRRFLIGKGTDEGVKALEDLKLWIQNRG